MLSHGVAGRGENSDGVDGRGMGGFVLAPSAKLFCAYPEDGNSMSGDKTCNKLYGDARCIPGCYPPGKQCGCACTRTHALL